MNTDQATVIIAAYNEQASISKVLSELGGGHSNGFQIVVVCNGCHDQTESIVREHFPLVYCEALPEPSKANAIRHAETLSIGFPRLYLDADIVLTETATEQLFEQARTQLEPALIVPRSVALLENCSWWVQRFYYIWYQTLFVTRQGFGAGCYLLNQAGRARFGAWPNLIADDGFIRTQFAHNETHIAESITVQVNAPKSLWALLKVKSRSKYGNLQLKTYLIENKIVCQQSKRNSDTKFNSEIALSYVDLFIYNVINTLAYSIAMWQKLSDSFVWHRDNSNR